MLIDSPFKDFYDTVQCWGVDKTVPYRRVTTTLKLDNKDKTLFHDHSEYRKCYVSKTLIGFCGKFYPVAKVQWHERMRPDSFFYDQALYEKQTGDKESGRYSWWNTSYPFWSRDNKPLEDIFYRYKVPAFCIDPVRKQHEFNGRGMILTLNPVLRDLKFQHVKDPATAFQEIYQFISGVLGTTPKETLTIDDKYKAIAHGHDHPYSFKKEPWKNKKE